MLTIIRVRKKPTNKNTKDPFHAIQCLLHVFFLNKPDQDSVKLLYKKKIINYKIINKKETHTKKKTFLVMINKLFIITNWIILYLQRTSCIPYRPPFTTLLHDTRANLSLQYSKLNNVRHFLIRYNSLFP